MRIELLDPRWKEQRDALEARKAQASELQRGANVVSSLKNLARTRVDIFGAEQDEERRKKEEEEERERRKEREKVVWDGHTASKANTLDKFSTNVNFDEQIAAIHRSKGLGPYVIYCTRLISTDFVLFEGNKRMLLGLALVPRLHLPRSLPFHPLMRHYQHLHRHLPIQHIPPLQCRPVLNLLRRTKRHPLCSLLCISRASKPRSLSGINLVSRPGCTLHE